MEEVHMLKRLLKVRRWVQLRLLLLIQVEQEVLIGQQMVTDQTELLVEILNLEQE